MAKRLVGRKIKVTVSKTWFARRPVKVVAGFFVLILLILFPLLRGKKSLAEEVILYPTECSGEWENAEAIIGDPANRTAVTAARPISAGQTINCRNFKGELPKGANITNASFEFIWKIGGQEFIPAPAIEESFDPQPEIVLPTDKEIVEEPVIEEPTVMPEPVSGPEIPVLPPSSLLPFNFISIAHAQEESAAVESTPIESVPVAPTEEVPAQVVEEPTEQNAVEEIVPEEITESIETVEQEASSGDEDVMIETEITQEVDNPERALGTQIFDIKYVLGENESLSAGTVEREYLSDRYPIQLVETDIPIMSVSLTSLITIDGANDIYLEAVRLVITYDKIIKDDFVDQPKLNKDTVLDEVLTEGVWAIRVKRSDTNLYEIWYADPQYKGVSLEEINDLNIWTLVAGDDYIHEFSPLGSDEGYIFWLNKSGQAIYMYNSAGQTLDSREYKPEVGSDYIIYKNAANEYKKIVLDFSGQKFEIVEVSEDEIAEYEVLVEETIDYSLLPKVSVKPAERNILIDPEATHFCKMPVGQINIVDKRLTLESIFLQGNPSLPFELEIIAVPPGIKVEFAKTKTALYSSSGQEEKVEIEIKNDKDSQVGSFSVPILYTQKSANNSTVICQLNILNK